MRITFIGATGLIGSTLVPKVEAHDLLVLTRRSTGKTWRHPPSAPSPVPTAPE